MAISTPKASGHLELLDWLINSVMILELKREASLDFLKLSITNGERVAHRHSAEGLEFVMLLVGVVVGFAREVYRRQNSRGRLLRAMQPIAAGGAA